MHNQDDKLTSDYWNNTRCYRLLSTVSCPPVAVRGAVSGRVAAATPVRPAYASLSSGRLALVAPTCLPAVASLSIYTILSRYTLTMLRALTLSDMTPSVDRRVASPLMAALTSASVTSAPTATCAASGTHMSAG